MQRSVSLQVVVHCPHFGRPVNATRNLAIDKLVACSDSERCRDPHPESAPSEPARPFPRGCPVFPSLAK
jgi:hypothetical protein